MSIAIVLLECPAHPDRPTVLVKVTDLAGLELRDARATLVDNEQWENVFAGDRIRDAFDVLSQRRWDVRLALLR